jgi:hypothetical protein
LKRKAHSRGSKQVNTRKSLVRRLGKLGSVSEKVDFLENLVFRLYENNPLNSRTLSAINTAVEFMAKLQGQLHGKVDRETKEDMEDRFEAKRIADSIVRDTMRDFDEKQRLAVAKVMNRMEAAKENPTARN